MRSFQKGFTLIELLVVIGIVGILLSITLVAINPARQFRLANDAARAAAINTLSSAIAQIILDNKGALPTGIVPLSSSSYLSATTANATAAVATAMKSLCDYASGAVPVNATVGSQTYLPKFPVNPGTGYSFTTCGTFNLGYSLKIASGRAYVTSEVEEPAGTIEAVR